MDNQLSGIKILCIEDEHFISELYARALTKAGADVKVVVDGATGLQEAWTDTYDIVLLDIMLPTMTGLELLDELRRPGAKSLRAKIIITTNLEQGEENREAVEAKADGYVIKAEMTPRQLVNFLTQFDIKKS